MALGSLLLFLALLIIVALILARPFMEGQAEQGASVDERSPWLAERERILDALAELDADWQLGKIPEEIYTTQREQLLAKGAQAIEEIDKVNKYIKKQVKANKGEDLDELIAAYKEKRKAGR